MFGSTTIKGFVMSLVKKTMELDQEAISRIKMALMTMRMFSFSIAHPLFLH
jgi:hypothetical protein